MGPKLGLLIVCSMPTRSVGAVVAFASRSAAGVDREGPLPASIIDARSRPQDWSGTRLRVGRSSPRPICRLESRLLW